jgi:hypothetical protein
MYRCARQYEFPAQFTDTTRAYFTETAKLSGGEAGTAMMRLIANPNDLEASAIVSKDPTYHSMLRTTCVPTYGVPGRFSDPDGNGVHGLNERESVEGLYEERDYLFDLIQAYANSK